MNKTLLVVLIIVVLAGGGYLAWQYLGGPALPEEFACQGDEDCVLAYAGMSACAPCDMSSDEFQCVSPNKAEELQQKRIEKHGYVLCEPCEAPQVLFTCVCEGDVCSKKQSTKQPPISVCGDGACEVDESQGSCPADCGEQILSKEQIAMNLMGSYLNVAKDPSITNSDRLLVDYRIDEISIISVEDENKCFRFNVVYSVLPESGNFWTAGNGTRQDDDWIVRKSGFVDAIKKNGVYEIREMGTGAPSMSCTGVDQ